MTDVADGTFAGAGGVSVYWQRVTPAGPPRGAVLLSHGYAEHLARYRDVVAHWTGRGLAVAALDHRGHGHSGGPRGHCRDFGEMVADLRTLAAEMERWWPRTPRVLFGHSMGGLIALLYLLRHPDSVRAGALSAPALRLPEGGSRAIRWMSDVLGRIAPTLGVQTALDARALSRDPGVGEAYVADPLVHRRASLGFVLALRAAQVTALRDAPSLRVPLLVLQGDADRLVDPAGAQELAARLTGPHEFVMLPGYYHELLNEPPAERARVVARLDAWIDRWVA